MLHFLLSVRLETSQTRGGELCGLETNNFEKLWEIKSELKNILNN